MYIHNKYVEYPGFPVRNMMYIYIYFHGGFSTPFLARFTGGYPMTYSNDYRSINYYLTIINHY